MAMSTLFTLSDDEILAEASRIVAEQKALAGKNLKAKTKRLFDHYAKHIQNAPEEEDKPRGPFVYGAPKALTQEEALLIAALERNKYQVTMHQGESHWWGDAACKHHVQDGAICAANSRRDLLLSLWACVSGQTDPNGTADESIALTEEHLNGSVLQAHLRELQKEVRLQEKHEMPDSGRVTGIGPWRRGNPALRLPKTTHPPKTRGLRKIPQAPGKQPLR